jgi:probable HAF family extracellular repeat protein
MTSMRHKCERQCIDLLACFGQCRPFDSAQRMAEVDEERIMKAKKLTCLAAAVLLAVLTIPSGLSAQEQGAAQKDKAKHSHYRVVDLGTFGGPHSQFNFGRVINRKGTAVGGASTSIPDPLCIFDFPYCFVFHAFQYQNNVLTDLGSLPGGANSFSLAVNSSGTVAGVSENGLIDPVTGLPAEFATVWKKGQIINLGTLGGSLSLAADINCREKIVGGGLNTIPDPFGGLGPFLGGTTQTRALLWQDGSMRDLGTLGGNDAFAIFVNERGQVAGNSYTNSTPNPETGIPTADPFFWENGRMVDVGTLGGVFGTVSALNNRGQVTGTSDLAGDQTAHPFLWERGLLHDLGTLGGTFGAANWIDDSGGIVGGATTENDQLFRAFRWKNGRMTNLGSLNGDQCSVAFGGNSEGQVVGNSLSDCDHETHAFLWENGGPMVDLNSFLPSGSGVLLREGVFINERGEIAVSGRVANGDDHAFVLVPVKSNENTIDGAQASPEIDQASLAVTHALVSPETVAAFAARFAHRSRGFGAKQSKQSQ